MALTRPKYSQIYDSDFKNSARVATTGTVTLAGGAPSAVDGVNLNIKDRVLVRAQDNASQNGIYMVTVVGTGNNGTWVRSFDASTADRLTPGTTLSVEEGSTFGGKLYRLTTPSPITLGTTNLSWTDVTGGGGSAGGLNAQIQYNDTNVPNGAPNFYYFEATGQVFANAGIASTNTSTGTMVVEGGIGVSGSLNVGANVTVTGNVLPSANVTYDLGGPTRRWRDLYLSGTTIDLNGASISATAGAITFENSLGGSFSVTGSASGQSTGTFGNLIANSGIASSSTSTGALTVTGGAGISGSAYIGGLINVTGSATVGGTLAVTGDTTITGNLTVNGTTTNINTTNLVVEDKNIIVADVATPTDTTADGAGITVKGATDKTLNWVDATDAWTSSEDFNLLTGKQYEIAGTSVLTATTLGSGVVNSSLTSLGTVTSLVATNSLTTTGVVTNLSSGNIVATNSTSGTWSTANVSLYESVTASTTNATFYPMLSDKTAGNTGSFSATTLTHNPSTGNLTATGHVGNFWGPVAATTANVSSTLAVTGTSTFTGATNHAAGITASTVSAGTIGNSGAALSGTGSGITSLGTTTNYQVGSMATGGTRVGGAGLSVNGTADNNDSQIIIKKPSQSTWSMMAWDGVNYEGYNIYYDNSAWVHSAPTGTNVNSLLARTTDGMRWYASNDGTSSWNQASNTQLWNLAGTWVGKIAPSSAETIVPSANLTYNLGSTTAWWNNIYGVSVQARYADLAEHYVADADYEPGTVVVFGGEKEITISTQSHDTAVAGIISTNPAYLMNAAIAGLPVALQGRVPCRVQGPVKKGDVLVTSTTPGVAQRIGMNWQPGCVLGKALESINTNNIQTIEVVVGRF
jgi:hypothetical protein